VSFEINPIRINLKVRTMQDTGILNLFETFLMLKKLMASVITMTAITIEYFLA